MAQIPLKRTDYWNRVTNTVRSGDSTRGENVADIEDFLLRYSQLATASLHLWGVADGLTVTAVPDQPGLTVTIGTCIDAAGHLIALIPGGLAVVDPDAAPDEIIDIATVPVDTTGIVLPTTGITGTRYLTIRYREVGAEGLLGNAPALVHAPWLRLLDTGHTDTGTDLVLAHVTLADGKVKALTIENRRHTTNRLLFHQPVSSTGTALTVGHRPAAELRTAGDGTLEINLPAGRRLHVDGHEVHSGGELGGFSFADRSIGSFEESPAEGERWVWYAENATANLWSGSNRLRVNHGADQVGLDVEKRMRIRGQSSELSAGTWLFQNGQDRAFVGMADDTHVGLWGQAGQWWGFKMDTTDGTVSITPKPGPFDIFGFHGTALHVTGGAEFTAITSMRNGLDVRAPVGIVGGFVGPAARFDGDVHVTGTLTKGNVQFRIDHPLDPANKYLHHSAIESDEMKNLYDGVVELDESGQAEIMVPDWFEALNEQFRYQLTPIGSPAPDLHVTRELADRRFAIAGGEPAMKVCWQVTGIRHDAYAQARPMEVEVEKSTEESGCYLHPEQHGATAERSVFRIVAQQGHSDG